MYGWRMRMGLVVPSSNTTIEPEFNRVAPDGVSVHAARVYQEETDQPERKIATVLAMNDELEPALRQLTSVQPTVIAFCCTAASFLRGAAHDQDLSARLTEAAGVPFITASTAVTLALQALGVRRVAMGTPYLDAVNERERVYLHERLGIEVVRARGLQIVGNLPKGRLDPGAAYRVARDVDCAEAEAVFLSCTNWRTLEVIAALEQDLGKPVVSSNQATLWAALRIGGLRGARLGPGALFDRQLEATPAERST